MGTATGSSSVTHFDIATWLLHDRVRPTSWHAVSEATFLRTCALSRAVHVKEGSSEKWERLSAVHHKVLPALTCPASAVRALRTSSYHTSLGLRTTCVWTAPCVTTNDVTARRIDTSSGEEVVCSKRTTLFTEPVCQWNLQR